MYSLDKNEQDNRNSANKNEPDCMNSLDKKEQDEQVVEEGTGQY